MKQIFIIFFIIISTSCSKNDPVNNCNYLPNLNVNRSINLNLPEYSQLQFTGNTVYIANEGVSGIYLSRIGDQFRAFDATDPGHQPSSCSFLTRTGGIGKCGCQDENEYSLLTGGAINEALPCALKEYRVENAGNNTLFISN